MQLGTRALGAGDTVLLVSAGSAQACLRNQCGERQVVNCVGCKANPQLSGHPVPGTDRRGPFRPIAKRPLLLLYRNRFHLTSFSKISKENFCSEFLQPRHLLRRSSTPLASSQTELRFRNDSPFHPYLLGFFPIPCQGMPYSTDPGFLLFCQ